ncbi:hypothetical protein OIE66_40585 [Nonomuraea sp. NBC_01738]|uniref:hypothetical protein n=1 Tax=Nonomuraea sp. NBC_01738 TaxID=2976003 RepID=UPI002E11B3C9|nr:hypothetical protein OIE66_40585 [Nonomuraea sp. NBC_01738]
MTCTHGHEADPKLCPHRDCRRATGHTDPDIQAAWREARDGLAALLRPYVQDHLVDKLATRYVDGLELRGWRPPLRPPPRSARVDPAHAVAATAAGAELARQLMDRSTTKEPQPGAITKGIPE